MTIWFTSDTHFGHANIIKYCDRPFGSLKEMDEELIKRWNDKVKPEDTVYFLGDFCFRNSKGGKQGVPKNYKYWKEQLNGNIIFIKGNHDKNNSLKTNMVSAVLKLGKEEIFLVHAPKDYSNRYNINLVGHVHEKWKTMKKGKTMLINVGVDVWDFKPVSWDKINNLINKSGGAIKNV